LSPTTANNKIDSKKNNSNSDQDEGETQKKSADSYRILLVDDDPDILFTFKEGLEEELPDADKSKKIFDRARKIQVDTFSDPKEAPSSFKAGAYDLLLLDIRMPDMNGFELFEELEKIDDKPKVCFITAYELYYEALKKDFPKLDVGCLIKKPISIEDLATRICEELV
jgi:DNA-binding response OmpR family regulator